MAEPFDDLKSGDPITPRALNVAYRELRRLRAIRAAAPLHISGADGNASPMIGLDAGRPFWIQLTGAATGSAYPWAEVTLASGRVVATTGVTGSVAGDPAYERRTGSTTLTAGATVYRAVRSPASGEVLFAARGGAPSGGGSQLSCGCTSTLAQTLPGTLHMTSSDHVSDGGMFQDATFLFQPIPTWATSLALAWSNGNCYLSTASFVDGFTGDTFQYTFLCTGGLYILTRVYQFSIFGNPFRDIVRCKWLAGIPGNVCGALVGGVYTSFSMTAGTNFAGSTGKS